MKELAEAEISRRPLDGLQEKNNNNNIKCDGEKKRTLAQCHYVGGLTSCATD